MLNAPGTVGGSAMDFYAVLDQAGDLLRQRGRVTYRALKLQFQLDDDQPLSIVII